MFRLSKRTILSRNRISTILKTNLFKIQNYSILHNNETLTIFKSNLITNNKIKNHEKISSTLNVVRGMANHRHKKILMLAKGYRNRSNRCYRIAKQRVMKAMQYSYRDRKVSTTFLKIFILKLFIYNM